MNMIPLVMANEPGKAQLVNPGVSPGIVVLISVTSDGPGVSLFGRKHHRG